jgi:hypothetical protein
VGVDVDVEGVTPDVLRRFQIGAAPDPGVGEEEIDGTEHGLGVLDEGDVAGLGRDVGDDPHGVGQFVGDVGDPVEVGDDDVRPVGVEPAGERRTDPAGRPGDDDVAISEVHRPRSYVAGGLTPSAGR